MTKKIIGFVGQGWIGKNYANDFEDRGYEVVRYGLEEQYKDNRDRIADCDIVFIAVPTPTTPTGFDYSIVEEALKSVGAGKIAVIKSTILPGTTETLQNKFPDIFVFHSPEFLTEKNAAYDAAHPTRNIVGIVSENVSESDELVQKAESVLAVLPEAPLKLICKAREAEIVKYGANIFLYIKIVYANLLYDLTKSLDCDWEPVMKSITADPRIGTAHMNPVHETLGFLGRGAGGHCFLKDYAAFRQLYANIAGDDVLGVNFLEAVESKNLSLLIGSNKDIDIIKGVYGDFMQNEHHHHEHSCGCGHDHC
jgi:UDPglucose 6-dehydrogenase